MSTIKPLRDRVAVQKLQEEEKSSSGIILPESATEEKNNIGTVVAVGSDATLQKGDKVIFSEYGFDKIELDEEEYLIMKEEKVLAIIK